MAERTTVQFDNPAIFLTFKHRFALLKIELGTGMEGSPATVGAVSAIMNLGIRKDAMIDNQQLGQMRLKKPDDPSDGVTEFKPLTEKDGSYYVIVPVEGQATTENSAKADEPLDRFVPDSLKVTHIKVDDVEFELDKIFAPRINTIYSLTVHKGEGGSASVVMSGIEEWGNDRYLSNVREEGGIYWASDLRNLERKLDSLAALGKTPLKEHEDAFSDYGNWDDDLGCFVFPVMREIDIAKDITDPANRDYSFKNFYGVLDGRGFTINGLNINGSGFIETLHPGSTVKDLILKNTTVKGSSDTGTGALVGYADGGTIQNCSVTGTSYVQGKENTGGLVGSGNPTIIRSSSNADVKGDDNTGGLIGSLEAGGSIDQSRTTGTVSGGKNAGGLVGNSAAPITNSHAGCDVTGKDNVGGLVGSTTNIISGCTSTGTIVGDDIVGGLAGVTTTTVNNSGANGSVEGTGIAGGLIGKHDVSVNADPNTKDVIVISGSYSRATVDGSTTGGLIGITTAPYEPEVQQKAAQDEKWIYTDKSNTTTHESTVQFDLAKTKTQWMYRDKNGIELKISEVEIDPAQTKQPVDPETQWTYYNESGTELFKTNAEIDLSQTEKQWIYYDSYDAELYTSDVELTKSQYFQAIPAVDYKAPKGTEIKDSYATNGKVFVSNSGNGISYSYRIDAAGTTNDGGESATYTISLNPAPNDTELNAIITKLNAGPSGKLWVKGLVIVDNKSYTLPVLNYK